MHRCRPSCRAFAVTACLALCACGGPQPSGAGDASDVGSPSRTESASSSLPPEPTAAATSPTSLAPRPTAFATARADAPDCGGLSKLALGEAKPLLQGRLLVRSVAGAEQSPVPWSVMGAPDAPTDRSRIYFEKGKVGLAVVATERYQRAGADFEAKARKRLAEPGGEVVDVKTGDPALRLVAWLPTKTPDGSSGTSFLLIGYARHPDGTVQLIQIGTFPEQFTSVEGCRALALRVAATLTPGSRSLEAQAGAREVAFFDKKFRATVPQGWVASTQPGPDFVVLRFRELAPFPDPAPELGIAWTGHPPPPDSEGVSSTQPGKLLGRQVSWQLGETITGDKVRVLFARARADIDRDVADAWINTTVPKARAEALAIAGSMVPVR